MDRISQAGAGARNHRVFVRRVDWLARTWLRDELIVSVIPVVLGNGKRLLPLEGPTPPLELVESRTQGRGIVELRYRFGAGSGEAPAQE